MNLQIQANKATGKSDPKKARSKSSGQIREGGSVAVVHLPIDPKLRAEHGFDGPYVGAALCGTVTGLEIKQKANKKASALYDAQCRKPTTAPAAPAAV